MNKTPLVQIVLWRLSGWLVPAVQAYWANRFIRTTNRQLVDASGRFDEAFVGCWERRLGDHSILGQMADQIYDHEIVRRESIATKAQSSLNTISILVALVSLVVGIIGSQLNVTTLVPIWIIWLGAAYFFMAFILAFAAVHVQRYIAVEYDEFESLANAVGDGTTEQIVARGVRARRLAAVYQNRQQTLCITNLVEASFLNLRNGIVILLGICVSMLVFAIPEGPAGTCGEFACDGGAGTGEQRKGDFDGVPRARYHMVWPREGG